MKLWENHLFMGWQKNLKKVCNISQNEINDDMTVLVTGIWDKIP